MRRLLLPAAVVAVLCTPSLAHAGSTVPRPNPILTEIQVDYVSPLHGAAGKPLTLQPLAQGVISQAVADQAYLHYLVRDDLGGFLPAPVGASALSSGGRNVVGGGGRQSQIPQFAQAATGAVRSYTFVGGGAGTPDNGRAPVPGLGTPAQPPAPTNHNTVPPPNTGFAGHPSTTTTGQQTTTTTGGSGGGPATTTTPGGGGGGGTTTTTTTPTTTTTTTTAAPPTTTGGGGGGGSPTGSCGTAGLAIESDLGGCRIYAINMAPGAATFEHVTLTNESTGPVTLAFRAGGTRNHLWNDLQMGLWETGSAPPSPLPPLLWWTSQENDVGTLAPGASLRLTIELALPPGAGNDDQGWTATIDFDWHAHA